MNVLVTGGAGYIGSVVVEKTLDSGHTTIVYDNLSKGHLSMVHPDANFVEGDILDMRLLEDTLRKHRIDAVIHMAASSLVGESVREPEKYFRNNVVGGVSVLECMRACGVPRIVFSSTAAVYGEPDKQPIEESDPTSPTNPYGESKLAFERELERYGGSFGIKYGTLRYFNAAGASERCGELHDPETHLIPIVLQCANGVREFVEIYGDDYPTRDGTCVRDYVHVVDLARAHVMALDSVPERSETFNLGCGGAGYSVREVIDAAREVTGAEIPVRVAPRRAGDPAVLIASSDRIRSELGWQPELQDLRVIVESAWRWMQPKQSAG